MSSCTMLVEDGLLSKQRQEGQPSMMRVHIVTSPRANAQGIFYEDVSRDLPTLDRSWHANGILREIHEPETFGDVDRESADFSTTNMKSLRKEINASDQTSRAHAAARSRQCFSFGEGDSRPFQSAAARHAGRSAKFPLQISSTTSALPILAAQVARTDLESISYPVFYTTGNLSELLRPGQRS